MLELVETEVTTRCDICGKVDTSIAYLIPGVTIGEDAYAECPEHEDEIVH